MSIDQTVLGEETERFHLLRRILVTAVILILLFLVALIAIKATNFTPGILFIQAVGKVIDQIKLGTNQAGSSLSADGDLVRIEQNVILFVLSLFIIVHRVFNKHANGILALIGTIFLQAGPYLPAPWKYILYFLGIVFICLQIRLWTGSWWIQLVVITIISFVVVVIAYIPQLAGIKSAIGGLDTFDGQVSAALFLGLIVGSLLVAVFPFLDGNVTFLNLLAIITIWQRTKKNLMFDMGAPTTLDFKTMFSNLGGAFATNLLYTGMVGITLLTHILELIEVPYVGIKHVAMTILLAAFAWVLHSYVSVMSPIPPWIFFTLFMLIYSTHVKKPEVTVVQQVVGGGISQLEGDTSMAITIYKDVWVMCLLFVTYLGIPYLGSLVTDVSTATRILSLIFG